MTARIAADPGERIRPQRGMSGRFSCLDDEGHPLPVWWRQRQTARLAVVLRLTVSPATQEQFNALDDRVGEAMMAAGGPPTGLMSHLVYPEGEGFVVAGVWRSETEGRDYVDGRLRGLIADVDLTPGDTEVVPAWSFARP